MKRRDNNDDTPPKKRGRKINDGDEPPKKRGRKPSQQDDVPEIVLFQFPFNMAPPPPNFTGGSDDGIPAKYKALKERIKASNMDDKVKEMALTRLKTADSDKQKNLEWIETLLKIPFKKYSELPVSKNDDNGKIEKYFDSVYDTLDSAVYGLADVKEEIINYISQIIATDNKNMPRVIALQSEPGCGKTVLVRNGLAKCLNRPFKGFSGGGMKDVSFLNGFSFTYSSSKPGCIVNALIDCGVMNPVIFIDEIDKVSLNHDGLEVINMLIHLVDSSQNHDFQDKWFDGISIDLSKVVFIFALNDLSLIHPVLKDRLHIIKIKTPSLEEKVIIGCKYLCKELYPNIGFKEGDVVFSEEIMKYIIKEHASNGGVRPLKQCMETILFKLNTARFIPKRNKYKSLKDKLTLPITITRDMIDELVGKEKNEKDDFFKSMFI